MRLRLKPFIPPIPISNQVHRFKSHLEWRCFLESMKVWTLPESSLIRLGSVIEMCHIRDLNITQRTTDAQTQLEAEWMEFNEIPFVGLMSSVRSGNLYSIMIDVSLFHKKSIFLYRHTFILIMCWMLNIACGDLKTLQSGIVKKRLVWVFTTVSDLRIRKSTITRNADWGSLKIKTKLCVHYCRDVHEIVIVVFFSNPISTWNQLVCQSMFYY